MHPVYQHIDRKGLNDFYNIDPELMKRVVGEDLHWHYVTGDFDPARPYERAIQDLYDYFVPGSTVLDCGCGWGGPGRMLQRDLGCIVDGVTISEEQARYCQQFFPTEVANLDTWTPKKHYHTGFFMESYSHMLPQALKNVYNYVDQIVLKDSLSKLIPYELVHWYSTIRTEEIFRNEFHQAGFSIQDFKIEYGFFGPSSTRWVDKLSKLPFESLPYQLQLTLEAAKEYLATPEVLNDFGSCTIYAVKI